MATYNENLLAGLLNRLTFSEMMGIAAFIEEQAGTKYDAHGVAEVLLCWAYNTQKDTEDGDG
jgi:hypothetical protein